MGLKYIETVKSIVLIFLVILSITFTFSIWTFTPRLETKEQPLTVDISIAEKKGIGEIVKPYKLLFNFEDGLKGTNDVAEIDHIANEMKSWTFSELSLEDTNFGADKLDAILRKHNQFTLFFHGEIPLRVYDDILNFGDSNIPEASFDRLIVVWNPSGIALDVHFISKTNGVHYSAKAKVGDYQSLHRNVLNSGRAYAEYAEIDSGKTPFIAVPKEPVTTIRNTYYQEETLISRFRDALFSDPNAVRRSQVGSNSDQFQDDYALMTVDTAAKKLKFVYPVAESNEHAIPSELLLKTIEFVNEHGGWTDEYRYSYMNPLSRTVKFQLYVHGLPVYSETNKTWTEMTQIWGDNRIFRYNRPYYTLDLTLPLEKEEIPLPSGIEVAEMLKKSDTVDFGTVEEIAPGYFMKHDTLRNLLILEPSWFYLIKGYWIRYSPEQLGGGLIGLE